MTKRIKFSAIVTSNGDWTVVGGHVEDEIIGEADVADLVKGFHQTYPTATVEVKTIEVDLEVPEAPGAVQGTVVSG